MWTVTRDLQKSSAEFISTCDFGKSERIVRTLELSSHADIQFLSYGPATVWKTTALKQKQSGVWAKEEEKGTVLLKAGRCYGYFRSPLCCLCHCLPVLSTLGFHRDKDPLSQSVYRLISSKDAISYKASRYQLIYKVINGQRLIPFKLIYA